MHDLSSWCIKNLVYSQTTYVCVSVPDLPRHGIDQTNFGSFFLVYIVLCVSFSSSINLLKKMTDLNVYTLIFIYLISIGDHD